MLISLAPVVAGDSQGLSKGVPAPVEWSSGQTRRNSVPYSMIKHDRSERGAPTPERPTLRAAGARMRAAEIIQQVGAICSLNYFLRSKAKTRVVVLLNIIPWQSNESESVEQSI
jgi:hypothetical protein